MAAASLGDEVRAVTVCYPDPEERAHMHALGRSWAEWDVGVPLVRLSSERRGLGRPIAAYVRGVAAAEPGTRVTVLIPETEPERLWQRQRLLQNQRGAVVAHAVRRETDAVICRLRFRLLRAGPRQSSVKAVDPAVREPSRADPIRSKRRFPLIVRFLEPHSRSSRWPIWPSSSQCSRVSRWWLSSPRG